MRCGIAMLLLVVVVAPSIGDFAARMSPSAACRVAPCCVGKAVSCPMHQKSGDGMRSCTPSDRHVAITIAVAVLTVHGAIADHRGPTTPLAPSCLLSESERSTPPPTPPPQRA
jgi:hypothetical protein